MLRSGEYWFFVAVLLPQQRRRGTSIRCRPLLGRALRASPKSPIQDKLSSGAGIGQVPMTAIQDEVGSRKKKVERIQGSQERETERKTQRTGSSQREHANTTLGLASTH